MLVCVTLKCQQGHFMIYYMWKALNGEGFLLRSCAFPFASIMAKESCLFMFIALNEYIHAVKHFYTHKLSDICVFFSSLTCTNKIMNALC